MNFMHDPLGNGHRYRRLNISDNCSGEGVAIEMDLSLPAERCNAP